MCNLLLCLRIIIGAVRLRSSVDGIKVAVDRCWYSPTTVDFLRIVEKALRCDGAWRRLSRFDGLPWLRRAGRLRAVHVHVHVHVHGFFDVYEGGHGELLGF